MLQNCLQNLCRGLLLTTWKVQGEILDLAFAFCLITRGVVVLGVWDVVAIEAGRADDTGCLVIIWHLVILQVLLSESLSIKVFLKRICFSYSLSSFCCGFPNCMGI